MRGQRHACFPLAALVGAVTITAPSGPLRAQAQAAGHTSAIESANDTTGGRGPAFFAVRATDGERADATDSPALHRRISLTLIGVPLGMAVQAIADRAGLEATFATEVIPVGARVSMKADDVTVASALRWVLVNAHLDVLLQREGHLTLVPRSSLPTAPDSSGVMTGALVDGDNAQPVPYGTITLLGTDVARFADRGGHFRIARLLSRVYRLRARQIGYAPLDTTVTVTAPSPTNVVVRMHRIPALLRMVRVSGRRPKGCVATGVPDSTVSPALAAVFAQVRENVDRYNLLLEHYPFQFRREETQVLRVDPGGDSTVSVDTVEYDSQDRRSYRVGSMVYRDSIVRSQSADDVAKSQPERRGIDSGSADTGQRVFARAGGQVEQRRYMYLPTFADLVDPAFLAAHCFEYGGTSHENGAHGSPLIRVNFQPANSITVPDVSGSIYLDAHRFVVRRARFELTKPEAADPPVIGFTVTTTFRELLPLVPIVDSVESEQPQPALRTHGTGLDANRLVTRERTLLGTDRVLGFSFDGPTPDGREPVATESVASTRPRADTAAPGSATAPVVDPALTRVHPVFPPSCRPAPAVDTISVLLYATLHGQRPKGMPDSTWSRYESSVLDAVSRSFDLPSNLELAAFSWPFEHAVDREAPSQANLLAKRTSDSTRQLNFTPPIDSTQQPSSTLVGFLVDEGGHPILSAAVRLGGVFGQRLSDANGMWRMSRLFPGAYAIHVRRIGYAPRDTIVFVARGPTATTDTIRMSRTATRLAVVTVRGHNEGPFVTPMMSTVATVTLRPDGSLRGAALTASSASPSADTLVLSALRRADSAHAFPRFGGPSNTSARPLTLDVAVSMGEPAASDQAAVIARLDAPSWPSHGAAGLAPDVKQPDILDDLWAVGLSADTAAFEFVVSGSGRALTSTARLDDAGPRPAAPDYHATYTRRMMQLLSQFSFVSGRVAGCAVSQFVRQRFGFRIGRGGH